MNEHYPAERLDAHFYLDNVPPEEASHVLRVLSTDTGLTPTEISLLVSQNYGFKMQKDITYTPNRLYNLGLATKLKTRTRLSYSLSDRGMHLQGLLATNLNIFHDAMHYLHYSSFIVLEGLGEIQYIKSATARPNLWSYRRSCELIWQTSGNVSPKTIAASILGEIPLSFPAADANSGKGGRFNATAAGCVYTWLRSLSPRPLEKSGEALKPRFVDRYELTLLALDDVYRARGYRYGDAVLMTDDLLDQIAGVFFLNRDCCAELLRAAAKTSTHARMADTLAGPSINLLRSYSVEDL